jgi:3-methyladenine DNA glycosylase AlkD
VKASDVRRRLLQEVDPEKAAIYPKFFKAGPGEYGEGDRFHGVPVPECRRIAKEASGLSEGELVTLLRSPMHEEREVALFVLVSAFERARSETERKRVFDLYVRELAAVNSWDLVDASAPTIVGGFLEDKNRSRLYRWARSKNLWQRRIAIMATFRYIKQGDFEDALEIAEILKDDAQDLIHKAVGWMLREIGNRDRAAEERFLKEHYRRMPRTMLRYAIEKFPEPKRRAYLKGRA